MQMANLDPIQEGETIPKDVWGAGERKMSLGKVFLHRNFVVCTKPGIVVGVEVGAGNSNTQPSCVQDSAGRPHTRSRDRGRERRESSQSKVGRKSFRHII